MIPSLKISMIQSNIIWEDVKANLLHYDDMLGKVDPDTDIVILPEMFSTGFTMNSEKMSEGFDGVIFQWLKTKADAHNFIITGSMIFRDGNKIFNRLVWMNPSGSFSLYDKRHLFRMGKENEHYSRGSEKLIVDYKGWRICPLICYDLRFPVWSRNSAAGYDLLIYTANWPASRSHAWNTLLRARAIENQCYVAGLNRVGTDGEGIQYSGESVIIDAKGYNLTEAKGAGEEIISTALDHKSLAEYRKRFPVSSDSDDFQINI